MGSWRIEIPNWRPATVNELVNCHWGNRSTIKRIDREMIGVYAYKAGVPKAKGRRLLDITIRKPRGRALDEDNIWKSVKDSLVRLRLLLDDSPKWCEQGRPVFERGDRLTVITLTDIEDV